MTVTSLHIPKKAEELWKHFKLVQIGISLDGFGNVNNFIRYPSQWSKIENNLLKLDKLEGKFYLFIKTTVSVLNIWHLPEFIEYIMRSNYRRMNCAANFTITNLQFVHGPEHLNSNILNNSFKEKIFNHFDYYKKKISAFDWQSVCGNSKVVSWDNKINRACQILDNCV